MEKSKSISWVVSDAFWSILMHTAPTKLYLSLKYRVIFGKWIDWNNPQSFTEKMQWLKVYGFKPEYVLMVDKVLVKEYVAEKIGKEYIIPTLTFADDVEDLDTNALPTKFVLKTNHDSGTAIVCKDKCSFDFTESKKALKQALKHNYYLMGRELPYKYVKRRVFAEEFIESGTDEEIKDYKFFCFNGEPRLFKINFDRSTAFSANYYDTEMNLMPFGEVWPAPDYSKTCTKIQNFDKMLEICRKLSKGIPFVRVDLYNINGKIYFGELTFYPTSGFGPFTDKEWDLKLGSWITLPKKNYHA